MKYNYIKEVAAAKTIEQIYHKGQDKVWNGKELLNSLIESHNSEISETKKEALNRVLDVILWGELAAWKVSSELAMIIDDIEPKLAATSQAHDEARHFYVMHDYMQYIGCIPSDINPATQSILDNVLATKSLAKKLLGMQLMIEPVAITIFRFLRDADVEPILTDLLPYYETDEARHIALGVKYLPVLIKDMSAFEKLSLLVFQAKILSLEIEGLRYLDPAFKELGISSEDVFSFAEKKQLDAVEELAVELGLKNEIWNPIVTAMNIQKELAFSKDPKYSYVYNATRILRRVLLGK